jgi:prolyl 4-hydroxylase
MASPADDARRLVAQGRIDEAAALLTRAAEGGDADALFTLASWRIQGNLIRRDLAAARTLLGRAAEAGRNEALRLYAYFLANSTGGRAEWGRARTLLAGLAAEIPQLRDQLDLADLQPVDEHGDPTWLPARVRLSESPAVFTAQGFASPAECDHLIARAAPHLQPSVVIDRATGRTVAHPDRKCDSMLFGVGAEDLAIAAIRRRVAAFAGVDVAQTEPLQVIRYRAGDEFRAHRDSVAPGENQRVMTALVYLTEDYEGGETRFVRTGLSHRGRRGDVLLFRNCDPAEAPDPQAEHAGMPVLSGTKIILSCWIRAAPYQFPPPVPVSRRF